MSIYKMEKNCFPCDLNIVLLLKYYLLNIIISILLLELPEVMLQTGLFCVLVDTPREESELHKCCSLISTDLDL